MDKGAAVVIGQPRRQHIGHQGDVGACGKTDPDVGKGRVAVEAFQSQFSEGRDGVGKGLFQLAVVQFVRRPTDQFRQSV
jgi:hypothetical protein